jgi:hypothetical protein
MGGDCQVVTVGAVQVGVVVQPTGDDRFDQWAAYRHPDGVVVFVAQSLKHDDGRLAVRPRSSPLPVVRGHRTGLGCTAHCVRTGSGATLTITVSLLPNNAAVQRRRDWA